MTQGDHVRARRGGAWDHAIDVGDRTVIRFVPGAGFERCEYGDFVAGADRVEVVVHRERVFRPSLVVARAFSRFAEAAYAGMFRSPGQFAVWCKTDRVPGEEAAPGPSPRARPRGAPRAGRKAAPARRKAPRKPARKAAPRRAKARRAAPGRLPPARKRARPAPGRAPRRGARKARRR